MLIRRLDDYQSWMIEVGAKRVAIDPWLREELVLPPGAWMFARRRPLPAGGPTTIRDVDALLLSAPFGDHCDVQTLDVLNREVPVFTNSAAAKVLKKQGFARIEVIKDGDRVQPVRGLSVEGVAPGFPYHKDSLGFLFEAGGKRAYLETHLVDLRHKARLSGLDALIIPVQSAKFLGLPLAMSPERALRTVLELSPARVIPTGTDPQIATGLMQRLLLWFRGDVQSFGPLLGQAGARAAYLPLAPGETVQLDAGREPELRSGSAAS